VAVLRALLARQEQQLLRAVALGVHVGEQDEPVAVEVAEAEVGHLDLLAGREDDARLGELGGGARPDRGSVDHAAPAPSTARTTNGIGSIPVAARYAAQPAGATRSTSWVRLSATTQPPKPAPVRRAPRAPARSSASASASSSGVETS